MKKNKFLLAVAGFILGLAILPVLPGCMKKFSESAVDPTIGLNGGFESVKDSLPVNWMVYSPATVEDGDFDLSFDQMVFKEGRQSYAFTVRKCSSLGGRFSPGISQEIPVKEGESYLVSFWVRNEGSEFLTTIKSVTAFGEAGIIEISSSETMKEWTKFEKLYTIPASMERLRFEVSILKPGKFWIDDVQIEKSKGNS